MFERFAFDNICCDEYGIRCVLFESGGKQTFDSQITELKTEKSIKCEIYNIISQEYNNPLIYTMQIVNRDFSPITQYQERVLKKWLCRKGEYKQFAILNKRYADICFQVNISNPKLIWINDVNGLEFTITTNSPVAFSDERNYIYSFDGRNNISIYINNDEDLPIYPSMIITSSQAGTLNITNQSNTDIHHNTFSIKNVKANEIITIDSSYPIIESSDNAHNKTIYNDMNKEWFFFINGFNNVFVDKRCTINFKYKEYRKVGLV